MKLVDSCLESEALKKRLQGLNELKDIVKSVIYTTEKNRWIVIFNFNIEKLGKRK